jgi:hypothetical protein
VDHHGEDQAERVDQDGPLAAGDLLAAVGAADPPFSVVLTDWLSMIAADGCRCRPAATRGSPRRASCRRSSVPTFFPLRKDQDALAYISADDIPPAEPVVTDCRY